MTLWDDAHRMFRMTQSLSTKMSLDDNEQDAGLKSLGTYFRALKIQN
jgi:hypothetical protein